MDINRSKIVGYADSGNGLSAASDLEAGDVIIEIASPYIVVVERAALDKCCSQCLVVAQENTSLKKCSRCKVTYYCSTSCQKEAWNTMHRLECSALAKMPDIPPTPVRALMQVLLVHSSGAAPDPRWRDLKTNQDQFSKSETHVVLARYHDFFLQARAACKYANYALPNALELAVGILCRMSTNAFRATTAGGDPIGICFEPVFALANHSCSPNAAILFEGRKAILRALDPIKKDEQIFISYIDNTQRRQTRQAELKEAYFFICNCEKCVKDETPYHSWIRSPRRYQNTKLELFLDIKPLEEFARSTISTTNLLARSVIEDTPEWHFESIDLGRARKEIDRAIRLKYITEALETFRSFRESRLYALPPYPSILHELYLYYLDSGAFGIALCLVLFMHRNCHFYSYPQLNHPSNLQRISTMVKLAASLIPGPDGEENVCGGALPGPKFKAAISFIDWHSSIQALLMLIVDLAPLSHGKDTRFAAEVASMLGDLEPIQKARRDRAGDALDRWSRQDDEPSKLYAAKIFEGLRTLGSEEVAEEVMDLGLHLLR